MDIRSGDFVWNSHKERANILKHGVDFTIAALAFDDPDIVILVDEAHSINEERYFAVGNAGGRIMTVRFLYRDGRIRIIGAGYWRKGKDIYEKKKN